MGAPQNLGAPGLGPMGPTVNPALELVNTGGNWENDGRVRSTRNVGMRQRNLSVVLGLNLTLINNNVNGILYIRT